jgi:hypothetical protein
MGITTTICVLKRGGMFNERYVYALYNALTRYAGRGSFNFVCLTDSGRVERNKFSDNAEIFRLDHDWPKWWSKLEAFGIEGPALYLDLDTVITDYIEDLIALPQKCGENEFYMLKPFNTREEWASGIMAWKSIYGFIKTEFEQDRHIPLYSWDQRYITETLKREGATIKDIKAEIPGIYSYKHHCAKALPEDTRIVLFHGRPRPHEVSWKGWVKRSWDG